MNTVSKVVFTLLSENYAGQRGVLAKHSLAVWVGTEGAEILSDTGQGLALAATSGNGLGTASAVVLSKGHNDHTGGLRLWPKRAAPYSQYAHPLAFEKNDHARQATPRRATCIEPFPRSAPTGISDDSLLF